MHVIIIGLSQIISTINNFSDLSKTCIAWCLCFLWF